jgi:hypothetical protein
MPEEQDFLLMLTWTQARQFHTLLFLALLHVRWQEVQRLAGTPLLETVTTIESYLFTQITANQAVIPLTMSTPERRYVWQILGLLRQHFQQQTVVRRAALKLVTACQQLLREATPQERNEAK